MLRAVGYTRVSTEEQAREGISIKSQPAKLNQYADLYNLELVAIHSDEGLSGKTLDRPGLRAALAMIDRGEVDGILIAKLDRITRSLTDWNWLIDEYFSEKKGKKLWSVGDSIDTSTAGGRLVLNVLMTVAQWEREAIGERTKDALQHKIRTGSRCGKVRFGSVIDPSDPRRSKTKDERIPGNPVGLAVEPGEAAAILLMRRLRQEGLTYRGIAGELMERRIPTKEGKARWNHTVVMKILRRSDREASHGQG